jgi:predicted GIY-YIG superfamily endonuclease
MVYTRPMKEYFVYMLCCSDGTYYVGVTNNYEKRVSSIKMEWI